MANVATAMYTINNATIFAVVTDAAVGSVDSSCKSDVCVYRQGTRTLTRQELCGTNLDSTALDQILRRTCFFCWRSCLIGKVQCTALLTSCGCGVHVVWTLYCWQRKRQ